MVLSAQENSENDIQSDTEKSYDETVVIAEPKIKSIKEAILSLEEVQYFLLSQLWQPIFTFSYYR